MKKVFLSSDGKTLKRVSKSYKGNTITIDENVEIIDKRAFAGCDGLEEIILPPSLKVLGEEAFEGCSSLFRIDIPEGVEIIPQRAFADCVGLAEVSLPSTLKELGKEAFKNCSSLESIDIPEGVEIIPAMCFESCSNLESAHFHDGLKEIGKSAFCGCKIEDIILSSTVETIGEKAFCNNNSDSLDIEASVRSIGINAFWNNSFRFIDVSEENKRYTDAGCDVIMEKETGKVIQGAQRSSIPKTATRIASCAFQNGPDLIKVPSSVKVIETGAFFNCPEGTVVVLCEGVTTIEWGAFQQMNGKQMTVNIPSSVSRMDGQFSSVEFDLSAANPYYRYDTEGHNIISNDGTLVWGHLLQGIPTEGVSRVELVNYGDLPYSELTVPINITHISYNICRLTSGIKKIILHKGTGMSAALDWPTNCEMTLIAPRGKSASGITTNLEYNIPKGTSIDEIDRFLGNDSFV